MRQWIQENQMVASGIALLLIVVAAIWMLSGDTTPTYTPEDQAWYFDIEEQRAFTAASTLVPPIESPWGNEAVRVFYFSCGACTESERFAGFYMKYSEDMKAKLEADATLKSQSFGESFPGRMYSSDAITWVEAQNVGDSGVTAALRGRCDGKFITCR